MRGGRVALLFFNFASSAPLIGISLILRLSAILLNPVPPNRQYAGAEHLIIAAGFAVKPP